jgi:hypothetical protein
MTRLLYLDLARGFTVLFIPIIHGVMLLCRPQVHETVFGKVLQFIAEWPGGQLLMLLMGMSIAFSKRPLRFQLVKGVVLFVMGYVLNLVKFGIPIWMGILPESFVGDVQFSHGGPSVVNFLLVGDILQLAGVSYVIITAIKRLPVYGLWAAFLAFMVMMAAPLVWDLHDSNWIWDHGLHLLGGQVGDCFFPVFPWLVYPLMGLALGSYVQLPLASMKAVMYSGAFLMFGGCLMFLAGQHFPITSFYRTWPDATMIHLGFVLVWVCLWHWIAGRYEGQSAMGFFWSAGGRRPWWVRMLCFCSKWITVIYLVQWVVVMGMVCLIGYRRLGE